MVIKTWFSICINCYLLGLFERGNQFKYTKNSTEPSLLLFYRKAADTPQNIQKTGCVNVIQIFPKLTKFCTSFHLEM